MSKKVYEDMIRVANKLYKECNADLNCKLAEAQAKVYLHSSRNVAELGNDAIMPKANNTAVVYSVNKEWDEISLKQAARESFCGSYVDLIELYHFTVENIT